MRPRNAAWLLFLVSLVPCARIVAAQDPGPGVSAATSGQERLREHLRERWRDRPGEQRETLERRLAELERLAPDERRELLERAQRLRERERELREDAPEDLRQRLEAQGSERGRELWKEHLRARGRALRECLPRELRLRLEQAPPGQRAHILERLLGEREELSRRALHRLGSDLHLRSGELRAFERLPLEDRLRTLLALRRHLTERPPGPRVR